MRICGCRRLNLFQLDQLLSTLAPSIVFSAGDEPLKQSLEEVAAPELGRPPVAHLDLKGGALDLRAVLLDGISRWGRL